MENFNDLIDELVSRDWEIGFSSVRGSKRKKFVGHQIELSKVAQDVPESSDSDHIHTITTKFANPSDARNALQHLLDVVNAFDKPFGVSLEIELPWFGTPKPLKKKEFELTSEFNRFKIYTALMQAGWDYNEGIYKITSPTETMVRNSTFTKEKWQGVEYSIPVEFGVTTEEFNSTEGVHNAKLLELAKQASWYKKNVTVPFRYGQVLFTLDYIKNLNIGYPPLPKDNKIEYLGDNISRIFDDIGGSVGTKEVTSIAFADYLTTNYNYTVESAKNAIYELEDLRKLFITDHYNLSLLEETQIDADAPVVSDSDNPIVKAIAKIRESLARGEVASITIDTDSLRDLDQDDLDAIHYFLDRE